MLYSFQGGHINWTKWIMGQFIMLSLTAPKNASERRFTRKKRDGFSNFQFELGNTRIERLLKTTFTLMIFMDINTEFFGTSEEQKIKEHIEEFKEKIENIRSTPQQFHQIAKVSWNLTDEEIGALSWNKFDKSYICNRILKYNLK